MLARLALALCLLPALLRAEPQLAARFEFTGGIGGISAIELSPDGARFIALNDRGKLIRGEIQRNAAGQPTALRHAAPIELRGPDGAPLSRSRADSEGLVWDGRSEIIVSYETDNRIWRHGLDGRYLGEVPLPAPLRALPRNKGMEALAAQPGTGIVTLPEQARGRSAPIWVGRRAGWSGGLSLAKKRGYAPVGADFGPDGALYVLLRAISGLGFAAEVIRVDFPSGAAQTIWRAPPGGLGNLEGLAVWRDAAGRTRLVMVADDNQNPFQSSLFVEYILPAGE